VGHPQMWVIWGERWLWEPFRALGESCRCWSSALTKFRTSSWGGVSWVPLVASPPVRVATVPGRGSRE
jgi:hypothetical protein